MRGCGRVQIVVVGGVEWVEGCSEGFWFCGAYPPGCDADKAHVVSHRHPVGHQGSVTARVAHRVAHRTHEEPGGIDGWHVPQRNGALVVIGLREGDSRGGPCEREAMSVTHVAHGMGMLGEARRS